MINKFGGNHCSHKREYNVRVLGSSYLETSPHHAGIAEGRTQMKKLLFIGLPLLLILVIGGVLYWHYITSPEYSLAKIKESITNHDITTFEKYVDVDGVIMRMMSQIPQVIGADKKLGLFGKDVDQLILSALQGPIINIAKESVRTVIERGYLDQQVTQTDSISKLFKQVPIDSFKIKALKEIRQKGKVCMVPLQIYVGAYEGETTLELMMRDKGSYWQVAEISNLPKVMYDIAQLQKTYPYRNRFAAVLYMVKSIEEPDHKAEALTVIATELAKAGKTEKAGRVFAEAIETANSIETPDRKTMALREIAAELAKAGKFKKAIETTNSIGDASTKAQALSVIATELTKTGKIQKAERIFSEATKIANSIEDPNRKAIALWDIGTGLAKAGKFKGAIEMANSIKRASIKARALADVACVLAKLPIEDKQEDAKVANLIMTALNR